MLAYTFCSPRKDVPIGKSNNVLWVLTKKNDDSWASNSDILVYLGIASKNLHLYGF